MTGTTYRYVRASGVRQLVKDNGKRCGSVFLDTLDRHIYDVVCRCIRQWNGNKKTLDGKVAMFITKEK